MTAPAEAAGRFLWACLVGAALGAVYDFLRPLRPGHPLLSDGLFLLAAGWGWLVLTFSLCAGDLRLGYLGGLAAGGLVWEWTLGQLLRPVFGGFWSLVGKFAGILRFPLKKIQEIVKNLFASWKK